MSVAAMLTSIVAVNRFSPVVFLHIASILIDHSPIKQRGVWPGGTCTGHMGVAFCTSGTKQKMC